MPAAKIPESIATRRDPFIGGRHPERIHRASMSWQKRSVDTVAGVLQAAREQRECLGCVPETGQKKHPGRIRAPYFDGLRTVEDRRGAVGWISSHRDQ